MMDGQRQAALALHGMHEPDRAWMLGNLDEAQRAQLSRLLTELRELGIPPEPVSIPPATTPATPPTPVERIAAAKPAQMRALLREEPVQLVAAVLALEPWPWTARFLARLPRARRQSILAAVEFAASRPAALRLRAALLARLEKGDGASFQKGDGASFAAKLAPSPFISWMKARWTKR